MLSQKLRRSFLKYFETQSHLLIPSSPVLPKDDPTLLFVNAGMNQFKDIFLGKQKRKAPRATTCQKCIRAGGKHNDLENVGHTSRHLTFFEMLGNFSFGDYFKKEAIGFAWDVSTHIFGFEPEKIWVSVYKEDDEAFAFWEKHLPANRIVKFGEEENFWAMGEVGPCGPCSELLYDRGEKYGEAKTPYEDTSGERFLEFWNLVFMQFSRDESGTRSPLPKKSIDTGAGLERIVALKMDVDSAFLTDILRSIIAKTENLCNKKYVHDNSVTAPAFHVIADHIRSLSFAIADGVVPSNIDRGYVLRKILRRAVRYGKILGFEEPFLADVLPALVNAMGEDYPELRTYQHRISEILTLEEEAFFRTLHRGGNLLNQVIAESKGKILGDDAFKLKDTYGLPIEEILLIAKDEKLTVDLKRFHELEEDAKEKSRHAMKTEKQQFEKNFFEDFSKTHEGTKFTGYDLEENDGRIIAMIHNGQFVDELQEGQDGIIILDKTPFYAEKGGQVADTGTISHKAAEFEVYDCQNPYGDIVLHIGKVTKGAFQKQQTAQAKIASFRRQKIKNNHSATHLLHYALCKVLGDHIRQAGSVVDEKRLRFDFNHHKPVTKEELREIEHLVNKKIRDNVDVKAYELSYDEAQKDPIIKQFFGDKYGDVVRVIDMGFSKELCGGTHTDTTGKIGYFKIAKESSIAAGVRRIEAMTGEEAENLVDDKQDLIDEVANQMKTTGAKLLVSTTSLVQDYKNMQKQLKEFKSAQIDILAKQLQAKAKTIKNIKLIAQKVSIDPKDLALLADKLLAQSPSLIVALAATQNGRCQVIIKVSDDLLEKKIYANELIKLISSVIEGGGGGKKDAATAGGKNITKLDEALTVIEKAVEQKC